MGTVFSFHDQRVLSANPLLEEYRACSLAQVQETHGELVQTFGRAKMVLDEEEFDEVFSLVFADVEAHFELFDPRHVGRVNVFEVFAGMMVFANDASLREKATAIFDIFDFDGSRSLNTVEVTIMLEATVYGMCKLTGQALPVTDRLDLLVPAMLATLDANGDESVSRAELVQWVTSQEEITRFVDLHVGARDLGQVRAEHQYVWNQARALFNRGAAGEGNQCTVGQVREVLQSLPGAAASEAEVETILELVDRNGGTTDGLIGPQEFDGVVEPWSAFQVVDVDRSGSVDATELKVLLWLMTTREPNEHALSRAMRAIDEDRSGHIQRLEWVLYNATRDVDTGNITFGLDVRNSFMQADKDGSGAISSPELEGIVCRSLESVSEVGYLSESSRAIVQNVIHDLTGELLALMDASGNGLVEWVEWKNHEPRVRQHVERFKDYVRHLAQADRDGLTRPAAFSPLVRSG